MPALEGAAGRGTVAVQNLMASVASVGLVRRTAQQEHAQLPWSMRGPTLQHLQRRVFAMPEQFHEPHHQRVLDDLWQRERRNERQVEVVPLIADHLAHADLQSESIRPSGWSKFDFNSKFNCQASSAWAHARCAPAGRPCDRTHPRHPARRPELYINDPELLIIPGVRKMN
eukprot:SAG31_NODE_184_length_20985_cov_28.867567_20_plen_171_part_00